MMELHYLPTMLETNSFDAIVHEHLEYYSLAVLERLLAEAGLEVVARRAQRHERRLDPPVHRATPARRSPPRRPRDRLQELRIREFELALDSPEPYEEFAAQRRTRARRPRRAVPLS